MCGIRRNGPDRNSLNPTTRQQARNNPLRLLSFRAPRVSNHSFILISVYIYEAFLELLKVLQIGVQLGSGPVGFRSVEGVRIASVVQVLRLGSREAPHDVAFYGADVRGIWFSVRWWRGIASR